MNDGTRVDDAPAERSRGRGEIVIRLTNRAIFVVLGLLGLIWLIAHATHILIVLFVAVLLATAVSVAANRLERLHVRRPLAILIVYIVVLAVLAGVISLLVPLLVGEFRTLVANLPTYQSQADSLLARLPKRDGQPVQVSTILGGLGGELNGAARSVGRGALRFGSTLVTILLIFVIAFFLAVDPQFAQRVVTRFVPPSSRHRTFALMSRIGDSLGHWVRAQLLLALFFGVTFGLGLVIMREPYAFTLGTIGAVLEIIPYVGGFITIVLAVLVALTTGKLWLVIAVLIWYAIAVNLEAHIVAPKLVGDIVGLHPLVVVLALFIGAEMLGVLGALLAVPLAVILQALLDEFWTFSEPGAETAPHAELPLVPEGGPAGETGATESFKGSRSSPEP